ncbi:dynein light chain Tctex-type 5-like [Lycorma delicatula]|uniref:dynein light chain Tctex-type 5-like n=1 Tax=Lycorma delicatula TaxID=130591 RepID=UPI003F50DA2E
MNSYRLDSKNPFRKESVYMIIRDVFKLSEMDEMVYEPGAISKLCVQLASEIRTKVKALGFERYKLVCVVQICEKNRQSVKTLAKFLWDPERDNCATYRMENKYFLISGAVFGLYYE